MRLTRAVTRSIVVLVLVAAACGETSTEPQFASAVGDLAVGEQTACALASDGSLYCWGLNSTFFEYGMEPATAPTSNVPFRVSAPPLAALVPGVSQRMCGQAAAPISGVYCWGRGGVGQLGAGGAEALGNTYTLMVRSDWDIVTISRLTGCGVTSGGVGMCWGTNQRGEIGTTAVALRASSSSPIPVETAEKFKMIAAGWQHACGITTNGVAMCWGDNRRGQLGIGTFDAVDADPHRVPIAVSTNERFAYVASGALQTCAVTTDGRLLCWGDNETGQLGDGTKIDRAVPTAIASDERFAVVSIGSGFGGGSVTSLPSGVSQGGAAHACALTTKGKPFCWGWNSSGQVGDGTTTDRPSPVAVAGALTFSTIGTGGAFSCGMRGENVICWGSNSAGQLGRGQLDAAWSSPGNVATPFRVP